MQSKLGCFIDTNKINFVAFFGSIFVFCFLEQMETLAHNLCLRVTIKIWQSHSKIPAITNLGFFLAALIKPIHADLLLINFDRRKGRVCIFATQMSPHFKGFLSEPELRDACCSETSLALWYWQLSPLRQLQLCVTTLRWCQFAEKWCTNDQNSVAALASFGLWLNSRYSIPKW